MFMNDFHQLQRIHTVLTWSKQGRGKHIQKYAGVPAGLEPKSFSLEGLNPKPQGHMHTHTHTHTNKQMNKQI
jgi:hypothetical protein